MKSGAHLLQYLRGLRLRHEFNQQLVIDKKVVSQLKELTYKEQWFACKSNKWFHILTDDLCIFTFAEEPKPSFSFLDCPLEAMPFSDYLAQAKEADPGISRKDVEREYNEQYLTTCPERKSCTPMRYDLDPGSYREGVHPVAHIHIGLENHIRLGLKRELTPLAFLLFVTRQRYPRNWEHLLEHPLADRVTRVIREDLQMVPEDKLSGKNELEHYLE